MLITLVIIGVVAALTIPNLMQKYQEQTTVKKLQKFYTNLSNAYALAEKENGSLSDWGVTGHNQASANKLYEVLFKPYFKIAKNCGTTNTGNCIQNSSHKRLDNDSAFAHYGESTSYYKVVLDDNSSIWFCGSLDSAKGIIAEIDYDVNGAKEPNQLGRDLFRFYIMTNNVFPNGMPNGPYYYSEFTHHCLNSSKRFGSGWACAAWVIYKGNMDYLHCEGLTWKNNSCKDK